MTRILYFNITFACNNRCVFCFSHSTFFDNTYTIKENDVVKAIKKYNISSFDRVILNGGEPTLHPGLLNIARLLYETGAEIVLYTNGRKLKNKAYCNELVKMVDRVVIPIHGEESVHDFITQKKDSYSDTICGIGNVLMADNRKLELKFIVTDDMIHSFFSITDFLLHHNFNPYSIVLTGVVPTMVSQINQVSPPSSNDLGEYISYQLNNLLQVFSGSIKLFDCELCHLSEDIRAYIYALPLKNNNHLKYDYYYFDGKYNTGKLIHYNNNRECKECSWINICRRISDACIVLEIGQGYKKIVLE